MKRPNRNDVARAAEVSGATVSRVLSGASDVPIAAETRERVLAAAERLGYRVNRSARALVTGRTHLVALWLNYLHSPFQARLAQFTAFTHRPSEYQVLITDMVAGPALSPGETAAADVAVDGILAHEGGWLVAQYLRAHPVGRPPIVLMGAESAEGVDLVQVDLYAGQVEATRHLCTGGGRRIAYLVNAGSRCPGDARHDGYVDAVTEAGLAPEFIETPDSDQTRATACAVLQEYIRRRGAPDGIVCLNDEMAIGANRALREAGRRVPGDVRLVGCDGIEDTEYQSPPLSTIAQPLEEMAETAWRFLQVRMKEPDRALQRVVLRPRLVIRESSLSR